LPESSTLIIGIAGPSASGKSLFAHGLQSKLASQFKVGILSADSYYRSQAHLGEAERANTNFDHPDAIEDDLLVQHAQTIASGKPVDIPIYDFHTHDRSSETQRIDQVDILIVEGILIFHWKDLCELMQLKVFIDVPMDVCLKRRIERDAKDRGRPVEYVIQQFESAVRPMYSRYVRPSISNADLIVPGGGKNLKCLDVVVAWCHSRKTANHVDNQGV